MSTKLKMLRITIAASASLFVSGLVMSCNYMTEPQPFFNTKAHPPEYPAEGTKRAILSDYTDHEVIVGTFLARFLPDIDTTDILQISLWIDSVIVGTSTRAPYSFSFNSQLWQNGEYRLSFGVYKKKKDWGLLGLLDIQIPPAMYDITLIFHHPPLPPTEVCVVGGDYHPWVYWNVPLEADVRFYVIRRNGITVLDTLFNPSVHGYFDATYNGNAWGVHYDVGAGNEYGTSFSQLNTCYY